jgi:hypothetical protein
LWLNRVKKKLATDERVNLLARPYTGMGIWTFLWCPTILFLRTMLILTHR